MKKFRRILLAVDESPCTDKIVNYTKDLIANEEVSIALLTVIPPTSPSTYGADPLLGQQPILVPEITEIQQNTAEQYVAKVANEFQSIAEVFTYTRIGNIKEEILLLASEWSADLIVMGTNGRSGFDHFISGSVSESVIRKANVPVLVVPINCS
ncbi:MULTISPECIES: universal stress protein [Sphingobacterium]|uniref:Universal stress protein n=1 Tax=Sphingobacterium litopenaei TaxID=2763500 RepID=A0ABR7YAU7_9SPHI|nr:MULTISPECIES: universal stress protein [Sphingobacterium]MBD1428416.1 universal stress protein [Sphingobacterium litopenaei]NGM71780.1 universal stress protein [Sphingobacterium sp. SGL-16]